MGSHLTTYACAACGVSSKIEITDLREPVRRLSIHRDPVIRRIHEERVRRGKVPKPKKGEDVSYPVITEEIHQRVRYATCPRCGARNPEGVALQAKSARATRSFNVALFAALAVGAYFIPYLALLLPVSDLVLWKPLAIWTLKKRKQPVPLGGVVRDVAIDVALVALVVLLPRAAPVIPALAMGYMLVRKLDDEGPWRRSRETIRVVEEG